MIKDAYERARTKTLYALQESEPSVCAFAAFPHMTQSAILHQRKVHKDGNSVGNRCEKKMTIHFPADEHVHAIMAQWIDHLMEKEMKPE